MASPIEQLLDGVEWKEVNAGMTAGEVPHMTHTGVVNVGGIELQCGVLSNGKRIFYGPVVDEMLQDIGMVPTEATAKEKP